MTDRRTVLITNQTLWFRSGTETYIRDFATGLLRNGHAPVVFSPQLGEVADELRTAGVPVTDDLDGLGVVPDVIHGQHSLETMSALLRFPTVPAVFFCHDASAWHDTPLPFPQIRRYVAVDRATRDRLVMCHAASPEKVHIIPNAVDLTRFRPVRQLPSRPHRSLVFSNYMEPHQLAELRAACAARSITLDAVGELQGNKTSTPEALLPEYDLVFAKGRCALEAMACGAATIVCDAGGCGPLVTAADFDRFRSDNFGRRLLLDPLRSDVIGPQIDRYDARDAAEVTARVRTECGVEVLIERLLDVYRSAIADRQSVASEEILAAAYEGVNWWTHHWARMLQEACAGYGDEVRRMLEAQFEQRVQSSVRLKFIPRMRRSIRKRRQALADSILSFVQGRKPPGNDLPEDASEAA